MVQLSATRCICIATLWVSLVSFAAITLCVATELMFIVVVYFVMTQSGNFWIHPRIDSLYFIPEHSHCEFALLLLVCRTRKVRSVCHKNIVLVVLTILKRFRGNVHITDATRWSDRPDRNLTYMRSQFLWEAYVTAVLKWWRGKSKPEIRYFDMYKNSGTTIPLKLT
jgi:hypothetical protein